jgi:hypothetical protein
MDVACCTYPDVKETQAGAWADLLWSFRARCRMRDVKEISRGAIRAEDGSEFGRVTGLSCYNVENATQSLWFEQLNASVVDRCFSKTITYSSI